MIRPVWMPRQTHGAARLLRSPLLSQNKATKTRGNGPWSFKQRVGTVQGSLPVRPGYVPVLPRAGGCARRWGRRAGPSHSTSARTEPEHGDLSRKSRQCLEAVRGTFLYSSITSSFNFSHLFGKMIAKTLYPTISTSLECQAAPSGPSSHCKNRPSRLRGFSQRRADDCSRQNNRMLTSSLDGSNQ